MPTSGISTFSTAHRVSDWIHRGTANARSDTLPAITSRLTNNGATLNAREGRWAQVTLPSGEVRRLPSSCRATIGVLGNSEHSSIIIGKAGRNRWKGIRPRVRGTAMNPIAHPMGGGEGRNSGGRHPCSPTGKLAKGGRTRSKKKASSKAIIRRRRSVRYGQVK